jgi:excisionase family DNA binding protein
MTGPRLEGRTAGGGFHPIIIGLTQELAMNTRSSLAGELEKMPHALRASELAKILSTSKMTIYRLVEQGAIPHFRVGGLIRFDPQAVADWLRRKMPLNQTAA